MTFFTSNGKSGETEAAPENLRSEENREHVKEEDVNRAVTGRSRGWRLPPPSSEARRTIVGKPERPFRRAATGAATGGRTGALCRAKVSECTVTCHYSPPPNSRRSGVVRLYKDKAPQWQDDQEHL